VVKIMKYRKYKKKLQKDMFNKVELLNPNKDDIILLSYPVYQVPQRELYMLFKTIKIAFKRNSVLAIPDRTTVSACSKEYLKKCIDEMQRLYETI
jgi:hypothetical protein